MYEKRLEKKQLEVQTLKDGIQILSLAIEEKKENHIWNDNQFVKDLDLLDDYDHENLDVKV